MQTKFRKFWLFKFLRVVVHLSRAGVGSTLLELKIVPYWAVPLIKLLELRFGNSEKGKSLSLSLADTLISLGPVYSKFGRSISAKVEFLGSKICAEFSCLPDGAVEAPQQQIHDLVKNELRTDITKIFRRFSETAVFSSTIFQIHAAELLDGRQVFVRCHRTAMLAEINEEIEFLSFVARNLNWFLPKPCGLLACTLVKELRNGINAELNWGLKGQPECISEKSQTVIRSFKYPNILHDLSTSNIIIGFWPEQQKMERVDLGIQDIAGLRSTLRTIADATFEQLFSEDQNRGKIDLNHTISLGEGKLGFFGTVVPVSIDVCDRLFFAKFLQSLKVDCNRRVLQIFYQEGCRGRLEVSDSFLDLMSHELDALISNSNIEPSPANRLGSIIWLFGKSTANQDITPLEPRIYFLYESLIAIERTLDNICKILEHRDEEVILSDIYPGEYEAEAIWRPLPSQKCYEILPADNFVFTDRLFFVKVYNAVLLQDADLLASLLHDKNLFYNCGSDEILSHIKKSFELSDISREVLRDHFRTSAPQSLKIWPFDLLLEQSRYFVDQLPLKNHISHLIRNIWILVNDVIYSYNEGIYNISKDFELLHTTSEKRTSSFLIKYCLDSFFGNESLEDVISLAEIDHDCLEAIAHELLRGNPENFTGYITLLACSKIVEKPDQIDIGRSSLSVAEGLIANGNLEEALDFFMVMERFFPEIYEPYVLLYSMILSHTQNYRKKSEITDRDSDVSQNRKKKLLLSYTIWGDTYLKLFNDDCIASLLAPGNLPAVSTKREIFADLYATNADIKTIQDGDMYEKLLACCNVNFIEIPDRIFECAEYAENNAAFRYKIYGGLHHLSLERASSMQADMIGIGPDNLYSDGSFLNFVNYIDQGYQAVLFTATRAQAEYLVPVLDEKRDKDTGVLSVSAAEIVNLSMQFVHHSFYPYIVRSLEMPEWRSGFFIPHEWGLKIRSFHYHPAIIASEAIAREKKISWDYSTLDCTTISSLFKDPREWNKLKIIDESDDGVMLDIAFCQEGHDPDAIKNFSSDFLNKLIRNFNRNQLWNFEAEVNYRLDRPLKEIKGFDYIVGEGLVPITYDIQANSEMIKIIDERLSEWFREVKLKEPKL